MGSKGKFRIEGGGIIAASIFYALTGIICLSFLAADFRLVHMALIGLFSLASAYSLFRKRAWALWVIIPLFFTATTFAAFMLYYYAVGGNLLLSVIMAVYLVLTWIFTFYTTYKRSELKS